LRQRRRHFAFLRTMMTARVLPLLFAVAALSACGGNRASEVVVIGVTLSSAVVDPTSIRSYELWILNQVGRDDQPLSCQQLLAREVPPASENAYVIKY